MKNKKFWILLIVLTVLAVFPRAVEVFNTHNYFFEPEQGTLYLITKHIVVDHQLVLTAPQGGNPQGGFSEFFKGPAFNYLLAIPFWLANGDPFAGRLMMFILSILTVTLAFMFTKRMFDVRTASIIGFLLAISPGLKDYAAQIWAPYVIPILTVFFIYFLFMTFRRQFGYIIPLALTLGLMTHFELATAVPLTALLVLTGAFCLYKKIIPYKYYLLFLVFFLLTLSPLVIYDFTHNFHNIKGLMTLLAESRNSATSHAFSHILALVHDRWDVFSWNFVSTFSPNPVISLLLLISLSFGMVMMLKDKIVARQTKIFILYLALVPFFTFLVMLFYPGATATAWWLIDVAVIYCFLLGIILSYFWTKAKYKPITVIILLILLLACFSRTISLYKTEFTYLPGGYIKEVQPINYIYADAKGKPFGIVVLPRRVYEPENYDYLIWWIGYAKYNYQPYRTEKGLYYFLIESKSIPGFDKSYAKAYDQILNAPQKGKLLNTINIANRYIIEKRLVE